MRRTPSRLSPSAVRSRMSFEAWRGSSQSLGSSARRLSSARRFSDFSKSKRPPQQPDRLLDFLDEGLDFRAHACSGRLDALLDQLMHGRDRRHRLAGMLLLEVRCDPATLYYVFHLRYRVVTACRVDFHAVAARAIQFER